MQRTIQRGALTPSITPDLVRQIVTFAAIGAVCTVAYAAIYNTLRQTAEPLPSNALALGSTMAFNFVANRQITFAHAARASWLQPLGYGVVYLAGLAASTVALAVALRIIEDPSRGIETAVALATGVLATIVRFVGLHRWVFRTA